MTHLAYEPGSTGLLIIDPYNDFISEGGKLYIYCEETIRALDTVDNMEHVMKACRSAGIRVFIAPHHRWCKGDFLRWKHQPPAQAGASRTQSFAEGTWGGQFHPAFSPQEGDAVAQQHWVSSGFQNTDLDLLLRQSGVEKVIIIGMRANTCVDTTMRYAAELGYHVTLVKDAIAAFSMDEVRVTVEINAPSYASEILSSAEVIARIAGSIQKEER
ncbi:cysteine hydrolase family protein [Rhizobium sp. TRM95796]|uniref:cysteine hydrolase family protein n=1 Tax=Rhizobium sp. TRM95796 TaxID=2979862 RepID=UPI0021E74C57|nr:isochorismatase family cysteine hydrolase [Rhizobium sp. TRM95796]MCV3765141.1 cysteine hydrolase [Rhizobium sp. TRM95796]